MFAFTGGQALCKQAQPHNIELDFGVGDGQVPTNR